MASCSSAMLWGPVGRGQKERGRCPSYIQPSTAARMDLAILARGIWNLKSTVDKGMAYTNQCTSKVHEVLMRNRLAEQARIVLHSSKVWAKPLKLLQYLARLLASEHTREARADNNLKHLEYIKRFFSCQRSGTGLTGLLLEIDPFLLQVIYKKRSLAAPLPYSASTCVPKDSGFGSFFTNTSLFAAQQDC